MNKAIGFIGLGIMGFPMAGHLSKQHNVFVFNRSKEKTKSWIKKYSGIECSSIKEISELSVTGTDAPSSVKTLVIPDFRPTKPIVMA